MRRSQLSKGLGNVQRLSCVTMYINNHNARKEVINKWQSRGKKKKKQNGNQTWYIIWGGRDKQVLLHGGGGVGGELKVRLKQTGSIVHFFAFSVSHTSALHRTGTACCLLCWHLGFPLKVCPSTSPKYLCSISSELFLAEGTLDPTAESESQLGL